MSDAFDLPPPPRQAAPIKFDGDPRPAVGGSGRRGGWLIGVGAGLVGLVVFVGLSTHRTASPPSMRVEPSGAAAAPAPPPPPPPELLAMQAAARGVALAPPSEPAPEFVAEPFPEPPPITFEPAPAPPPTPPAPAPAVARPMGDPRGLAPILVIDFGDSPNPGVPPAKAGSQPDAGRGPGQNADEQFAARAEAAPAERSRAVMLHDTSSVVAQGAMIPAVLETALNSDLPGFTRAVVSRDVRSFDGRTVLIPRGSRVIGQYRNAQALGASRAFVIWTRILRPDGASIQIGSSGADELGRAGLAGKVDRHFLQRFGGSILLSVINAGVAAAAGPPAAQIVIGSSQDASSIASSASSPQAISPTIRVAQGTAIRIFVARDLDFSSVGAAPP
ncbi:TrbI/VirB10 family protein [Phenylobacterium sp. VNQ135]|uniref:TrbI/VirB10 family protein n=1 Tax=Phenylobacterium sp. VNQ135 TaxID=3400922 RepID=UPI003C0CC7D3